MYIYISIYLFIYNPRTYSRPTRPESWKESPKVNLPAR